MTTYAQIFRKKCLRSTIIWDRFHMGGSPSSWGGPQTPEDAMFVAIGTKTWLTGTICVDFRQFSADRFLIRGIPVKNPPLVPDLGITRGGILNKVRILKKVRIFHRGDPIELSALF